MHRLAPLTLIMLACTPFGCGDDSQAPTKPDPTPPAADPADGSWRFRPTLEQHLPAGATAEPVLELSLPRKHTVVILAAVLRKDAADVGIERWTFEQTPEQELKLVEGGERLLRLTPGKRHPELGDLRRRIATPRAVLTRPVGLSGEDPKAVIEQVAAALTTMQTSTAEPQARVEAAATVIRGLDDPVALERDAIWALAALLDPPPKSIEVESKSERRAKASFVANGRTTTLELQRKTDGWAIVSFDAPAVVIPSPEGGEAARAPTKADEKAP